MTTDRLVMPVLESLRDCLCAQVALSAGGPTCFCGLLPGSLVAMDFCDCEGDGQSCGMAWVRLDSAFPTTTFPQPAQVANCATPLALRVQLGVTRCLPVTEDAQGNPPTEAAQAAAVEVQMSDFAAMRAAVECCFVKPRRDYVLGAYLPIGPQGACGGGALTVTVRVM